jgi:hypothetical protein
MSRRAQGLGLLAGLAAAAALTGSAVLGIASADPAPARLASNAPVSTAVTPADHKQMLMKYCTACHNDRLKTAGMSVVPLDAGNLAANNATWEKILRRLSPGEMPPKGMPRPPRSRSPASPIDWPVRWTRRPHAIANKNPELAIPVLRYLADKGAKLDVPDEKGDTPADFINRDGQQDIRIFYVQLLKDKGVAASLNH